MTDSLISTPMVCPLTHMGWLKITGADACKFLQGQVTCDVVKLPLLTLQHGAHCTAKGRMVANFDLIKLDEQTLLLQLPADNLENLRLSLSKYIVFSKAKLETLTLQGVGLSHQPKLIPADLPAEPEKGSVHRLVNGALALVRNLNRIELWSAESSNLTVTSHSSEHWQALDILDGKGWVTAATRELFLPQELNLQCEAIGGINFKKGCYTGQEIVARLHYKGKLKQHLTIFNGVADSAQEITAAAELVVSSSQKSVGRVVNAVNLNGQCLLVAVANTDTTDDSLILTHTEPALPLHPRPLPYAIT